MRFEIDYVKIYTMKNGGNSSKIKEVKFEKTIKFTAESIIENALNLHATDVHIEPRENSVLVRFRIGGVLKNMSEIPKKDFPKITKYFKSLAGLNFSEKTFPQSSTIHYGEARIRISTTPVFLGEKITLRLMRARKHVRKLNEIGLWGENLRAVEQILRQPRGIVFTVGDGSNTTNFSILNELNSSEKNIVTIEKTIEKTITGINQTEINPKIGLGYFEMTKSALSQNPDIIYIDNLNDRKTAELIFDSAMRGKFIIASVPVRKTSEVIPFLSHLGIEPFLIIANVLGIISQTIMRTISKKSTVSVKISKEESSLILQEFNISPLRIHQLEKDFKNDKYPNNSLATSSNSILNLPSIKKNISPEIAFSGTTGIFEVLNLLEGKISKEIKELIPVNPSSVEIEEILSMNNFVNLRADGLLKVLQKETVLSELMRRTGF